MGAGKNRKKRAGNARPYDIGLSADYARRGDHRSPAVPVSSAGATPGTGNMRIRRCVNAPLKKTGHRCGRSVRGRVRKKRKFYGRKRRGAWEDNVWGCEMV